MGYTVLHYEKKVPFESLRDANTYAVNTGLGFPDVVITESGETFPRFE